MQIGDKHINAATLTRKQTGDFRRQTSMVFQHYNLFKNKTALENITEILRFTQKLNKAQARERGQELLAQVGLRTNRQPIPALFPVDSSSASVSPAQWPLIRR